MADDNKKNDNNGKSDSATGMCVGLALGTSVGLLIYVFTGELLWMPLCLGVGMTLGLLFSSRGKAENGDDKQDTEK